MKTKWLSRAISAFGGLLFFFTAPAALDAQTQVLHSHVPAVVKSLQSLERFPGTNHLSLAVGLPLRNPVALSNLLQQIYDPASPNYRHYLTPEQFTERFGPTEADYQAVMAYANANGLRVTTTHPNRVLLDVSGSVANVERALHVTLRTYQHPTENRTFYAPDTEPSLDLAVPILHISGLNDYSLPRPRFVVNQLTNGWRALPNAGSGPTGGYMGNDFRAAYVPDSLLNGSGQIVGLLQFDGYTASDITYYEGLAGLPKITLQNVLLDGFSGIPTHNGGEVEVSLDIETAISMATNLSAVIVYEAGPHGNWHDILNRMATDNLAKQLSCSWYIPGGGADAVADQIWQQMAAQGQSFFNASGDDDAWTGLIPFPGDTPYITQVGGTSLTTTGPGGSWVSETVWNWGNGIGSGGGISTQYPIPSWQTNISMTANQGSTTKRNTPDVALTADNVYVRANGHDYSVGGTSCAAPLWAGFAALVNQQANAAGKPAIGFINPAVDAIGTGVNYTPAFHDITTGNNESSGSPTKFLAVGGYDLCTGWGTPAGQNLINALVYPEALLITPPTGFTSTGGFGGPFTTTSQDLTLTNAGTNSLNWMVANMSPWLTVSSTGGTLTPGGPAATVTVSLNSAASNLVVGTYNAAVWFTNLNDNVGQGRQFALVVVSPPTITMQPNNQAVLEGATANFTVAATGGLPLSYQWKVNGTNLTDGGNVSGSTTTNLVISTVSSNDVGTYTVVVTNVAGSVTGSNVLLTITPSPPVLVMQPSNQTAIVGGTVAFAVTAIGTTPYFYQWNFNGTNISGATNTSLTLANAQLTNAGVYSVTVTNLYGSATSSNAVLTVLVAPPCDPAPSGLVSWWPAGGNANDIAGTNNGTLINGAAFAPGEVGLAFSLSGLNYVSVPDAPALDPTNAITVECWFYRRAVVGSYDPIVKKGGTPLVSDNNGYTLEFNGNNILFWIYSSNAGWRSSGGAVPLQFGQWYHVAGVYDGAHLMVYTNGQLAASSSTSGRIVPSVNVLCFGRDFNEGRFFNGLIDEISIYNRALSSNEIAAIYSVGSGGKCPVPPTILVHPTNQTVSMGGTATFSVSANGTPPLFYQWSCNGTNISSATNASLSLTNVQPTQAGTYVVQVANAGGATNSANAALTVNTPPGIAAQPAGCTNVAGTTASFIVVATGSMPLTYQWKKNGTNVVGATSTNFTIANARINDAATYSVAITNAYGSILSSNAVLVVNPLLYFVWNQIPSPRFANAPFAVVIQAQKLTNGIATNFTDTVALLSTNGVPVRPAVSGNFVQGVWTGAVAVAQTATNLVLQASDSFDESGLANPINVIGLPALTTVPSGSTLNIFWPVNPPGFVLETTEGLSPANWVPLATPPFPIGDQNLLPIQMSGTNAFYRLRFDGQ